MGTHLYVRNFRMLLLMAAFWITGAALDMLSYHLAGGLRAEIAEIRGEISDRIDVEYEVSRK